MNEQLVSIVFEKYGSEDIPLVEICKQHFAMSQRVAERKAAAHQLPVPFYKKTGHSGYFCSAIAWAEYLERKAKRAAVEWEKANALCDTGTE